MSCSDESILVTGPNDTAGWQIINGFNDLFSTHKYHKEEYFTAHNRIFFIDGK